MGHLSKPFQRDSAAQIDRETAPFDSRRVLCSIDWAKAMAPRPRQRVDLSKLNQEAIVALYEGNVSWAAREDGTYGLVARSAGSWNAMNVSDMLTSIAKSMPKGAKLSGWSVWIDMGSETEKGAPIPLAQVLAYAKMADRVELVGVRPKGKPYFVPKLKLTKGAAKGGTKTDKVYL